MVNTRGVSNKYLGCCDSYMGKEKFTGYSWFFRNELQVGLFGKTPLILVV